MPVDVAVVVDNVIAVIVAVVIVIAVVEVAGMVLRWAVVVADDDVHAVVAFVVAFNVRFILFCCCFAASLFHSLLLLVIW